MPYSDYNDILKEMTSQELAKLSGSANGTDINYDRLDSALLYAKALIDAYLESKYDKYNISDIPPLIKRLSNDFCIVYLFEMSCAKTLVPQTIVWRKLDALKLLKEIQSGEVNIEDDKSTKQTIFSNVRIN
jgi:phage gp36-like protein